MNLNEFLSQPSISLLSDEEALEAAKAHVQTELKSTDDRMLNERGIFALIGMQAGETLMQAIEASLAIPDRVKSWFKPSEQGIDIADPNALAILAGMVAAGVLSQADSDTLTGFAYNVFKPFENATTHDFAVAKDDQTRFKQIANVNIVDGYLTLTWAGDFETHAPQVYVVKAGKKRRIAGFPRITQAESYECFVNNNQNVFVDDVYGAISNG